MRRTLFALILAVTPLAGFAGPNVTAAADAALAALALALAGGLG